MPRVEQTLASYLSPGAALSLKAPTLPSKPLRTTSSLVGKGYSAAGQAGACLHTMSLLQAYQADLLKGLADGEKVDLEELRRTADLALRTTKETARAVGQSMAAMVAPWWHGEAPVVDPVRHEREGLLACLATQSTLSSAGTRRLASRRRHSSGEARPAGRASVSEAPGRKAVLTPDRDRRGQPLLGKSGLHCITRCPSLLGALGRLVFYPCRCYRVQRPPAGVSRTVSSAVSCQSAVTGLRASSSGNTRGQPRTKATLFSFTFDGVFPTVVSPEQGLVMEQEVETLLRKEAIEVVPPHNRESGFYSRYFIVPKKDGGLRPIIDLRRLNRSVMKLKFKMLTVKQVVFQIRSEDWFVTIDLKDAYFHVSILPQHRKFLRFAFRGEAYQYRVLPFGLALSPRTFTKCVDAVLVPLRLQGICILNYIDDWLILAASES
ncbi:Transposon Ty3-G Gag-Pol polyprotein [Labeo rohita]|uniref:ribonuclease H n=1 Tax=Labeo rohita TaxID=84645 RepID=A0ABQ8L030_LABRO|nr:Transposon Ty3-G Gag-Pol polyprotein [Labeo rohita]